MDNDSPKLRNTFFLCLAMIFMLATGQGAFLFLIVTYMESIQKPVQMIGSAMALLSILEAVFVLISGFYYQGRKVRPIILSAILIQTLGTLILASLPKFSGIWIGISLNAAGIGVMIVILYAVALERRPDRIHPGLAVGLYTAGIAAGNGVGAYLAGLIADKANFQWAFIFSAISIAMVGAAACFLSDQLKRKAALVTVDEPRQNAAGFDSGKPYVWLFGIVGGFAMSSVIVIFDTLFPLYAISKGLTLSMIGFLSGLKMILAATIRPFSGQILARIDAQRVSHWGIGGLSISAMLLPFAGIGIGLIAVIGLMGLSFGTTRVTTAALALDGSIDSDLVSRRISIYTVILSISQSIGPFVAGWFAFWADIATAIVVIPIFILVSYSVTLWVIPKLTLPTIVVTLRRSPLSTKINS
jgi:MFS family permease